MTLIRRLPFSPPSAPPLLDVDFTLFALGPLSPSSLITETGLLFARDSASTVQVGDGTAGAPIDSTPGINYACIGNRTQIDSKRGLVFEQRHVNCLDADSSTDGEPRDYRITGGGGAGTVWLSTPPYVTVTFPSDGADQTGLGGSRLQAAPGTTTIYGDFGFPRARLTFSAWTKGSTVQDLGVSSYNNDPVALPPNGFRQVSRAASSSWDRLFVRVLATEGVNYFFVGNPQDTRPYGGLDARTIDMYADYVQLEFGDFLTEAIGQKNTPRDADRLSYAPGTDLIALDGQFKFYARLSPKFSSSQEVRWNYDALNFDWPGMATQAGFYLFAWGAASGVSPPLLSVPSYAFIRNTDKRLAVQLEGGGEVVSTVALSWAQYDELEITVAVGSGIPSVAKYRVNGGPWIDLVLGTIAAVPNPPAAIYFMHNGPNYHTADPRWDSGSFPCWLHRLICYGASMPII